MRASRSLRKAAHPLIPNYLKGCTDLRITPASVPAVPVVPPGGDKGADEPDQGRSGRRCGGKLGAG